VSYFGAGSHQSLFWVVERASVCESNIDVTRVSWQVNEVITVLIREAKRGTDRICGVPDNLDARRKQVKQCLSQAPGKRDRFPGIGF